jgi:hydroxyacid-oxoacid transhydrogenase
MNAAVWNRSYHLRKLFPCSSLNHHHGRRLLSTATELDRICELAASNLRFGSGATAEVGQDLAFMKAKRVIVVTDSHVAQLNPMNVLLESLEASNIEYIVYDKVRVEPNKKSFQDAIGLAFHVGMDSE